MNKPIYILGTGLSHDGSTCLMKNGKIVAAIEKERLTGVKHDGFNDNLTIQYCLETEGITFADIDLIVQENTSNKLLKPDELVNRSSRNIPIDIPTITISHHLAHAYSAIGTSKFRNMSVMVIDGQGSSMDTCTDINNDVFLPEKYKAIAEKDKYKFWESVSFYEFNNGRLKTIFKDFSKFYKWDRDEIPIAPEDMLSSIGEFYEGVTNYIFDKRFSEGKTMGLSSYGENNYDFAAFDLKDNSAILLDNWMSNFSKFNGGKYLGLYENFYYFANIAKWAQVQLEKAVIYLFNRLYDLSPNSCVSYAGGVALNAVLNSKIIDNTKFKELYIQPAAGDNGLAIGCCYYGWLEHLKKERIIHNGNTYFGKKYSNDHIIDVCKTHSHKIDFICDDNYIKTTAEYLANGKVVGWFQGSSEFGPRALGNRSILADPRIKNIRNFINRKIKHREDFRPFAPSILKEELKNYFDVNFDESDYMLKVGKVKERYKDEIPAVVHCDNSSRIQTVDKNINKPYYELIKNFYFESGMPILLNTSFNGANMPIVETPEDAISFFINIQNIDILVINNIIINFTN